MPEYPSTLTHVKVSEAFQRFSTIRHTWVRVWNVSGNLRRLRKVMASFHILLCHFVGCSGNLSQIFGVFLATSPSLMYPLEIKVTYFPKHLTVNTKAYASLIEIHSHNCWYFLFFKRSRHKFWIFPCKFESARETLTFSFSLGRTQTKSIFLHAMTEPKSAIFLIYCSSVYNWIIFLSVTNNLDKMWKIIVLLVLLVTITAAKLLDDGKPVSILKMAIACHHQCMQDRSLLPKLVIRIMHVR